MYFIGDDPLCRFACPKKCGRTYKRRNGLSQHLNYECGIEPKFKCEICNKKCAQKSSMKLHMINVHKIMISYDMNVRDLNI